jgi:hypothetical protein
MPKEPKEGHRFNSKELADTFMQQCITGKQTEAEGILATLPNLVWGNPWFRSKGEIQRSASTKWTKEVKKFARGPGVKDAQESILLGQNLVKGLSSGKDWYKDNLIKWYYHSLAPKKQAGDTDTRGAGNVAGLADAVESFGGKRFYLLESCSADESKRGDLGDLDEGGAEQVADRLDRGVQSIGAKGRDEEEAARESRQQTNCLYFVWLAASFSWLPVKLFAWLVVKLFAWLVGFLLRNTFAISKKQQIETQDPGQPTCSLESAATARAEGSCYRRDRLRKQPAPRLFFGEKHDIKAVLLGASLGSHIDQQQMCLRGSAGGALRKVLTDVDAMEAALRKKGCMNTTRLVGRNDTKAMNKPGTLKYLHRFVSHTLL